MDLSDYMPEGLRALGNLLNMLKPIFLVRSLFLWAVLRLINCQNGAKKK